MLEEWEGRAETAAAGSHTRPLARAAAVLERMGSLLRVRQLQVMVAREKAVTFGMEPKFFMLAVAVAHVVRLQRLVMGLAVLAAAVLAVVVVWPLKTEPTA